jgi:hypothetical protein
MACKYYAKYGVIGVDFLAGHRRFIYSFEKRLGIPLPFWDWIANPQIPARLNNPSLLTRWGVLGHGTDLKCLRKIN